MSKRSETCVNSNRDVLEWRIVMQIAICEDNTQIIANLEEIITQFFSENNVEFELETFLSGERLLYHLSNNPDCNYNLYLLDIEMGKLNGMEVAQRIRKRDKEALIIFVTSHDEFMIKAFDVSAFHFLIKPVNADKLRAILEKAMHIIEEQRNVFVYQTNKKTFSILYSHILYFESDKRKINIRTNSNTYSFYGAIKDIEKELPKHFVKIHKSYLINLKHVELVEGRNVQMSNGDILLISRSNMDSFYELYRNYVVLRME